MKFSLEKKEHLNIFIFEEDKKSVLFAQIR